MLDPFLDGAAAWGVPDFIDLSAPTQTHFADRAREFGVQSVNGDLLKHQVERAITMGRLDMVERAFKICPVSSVYRIMLPEGLFYPVIRTNTRRPGASVVAVTLYDAERFKGTRRNRNSRKRNTGNALRLGRPRWS